MMKGHYKNIWFSRNKMRWGGWIISIGIDLTPIYSITALESFTEYIYIYAVLFDNHIRSRCSMSTFAIESQLFTVDTSTYLWLHYSQPHIMTESIYECVLMILLLFGNQNSHTLLLKNQHIVFVWLFLFHFFKLRVYSIAIAINTSWEFIRSILCFTRIISGLSLAFIMFIFFFFSHFILFREWTVHCLHYIIILSFSKILKCSCLITRSFCRFISLVVSKMLT